MEYRALAQVYPKIRAGREVSSRASTWPDPPSRQDIATAEIRQPRPAREFFSEQRPVLPRRGRASVAVREQAECDADFFAFMQHLTGMWYIPNRRTITDCDAVFIPVQA